MDQPLFQNCSQLGGLTDSATPTTAAGAISPDRRMDRPSQPVRPRRRKYAIAPRRRHLLALVLAVAFFAGGAHAQPTNPVGTAADSAEHVRDLLKALAKADQTLSASTVSKLKKMSSVLSGLAPSLALVSIVVDLTGAVSDPVLEAIDKLQASVNGLGQTLRANIKKSSEQQAASDAIDDVLKDAQELGSIKQALADYEKELQTYQDQLGNPVKYPHPIPPAHPDANNSRFPKNYAADIPKYARSLSIACSGNLTASGSVAAWTTSGLMKIVQADDLSLSREVDVAMFIQEWLLEATKLYSHAELTWGSYYPPKGISGDLMQALQDDLKTDTALATMQRYIDSCTTSMGNIVAENMNLDQILQPTTGVGKFLSNNAFTGAQGGPSNSAEKIVNALVGQYSYFDWFAIKYPPVLGFDKHFMTWRQGMLPLFRDGAQDFNLVVGALKKDLQYPPTTNWTLNCGWYLNDLNLAYQYWSIPNPSGGSRFTASGTANASIETAFPLVLQHCAPSQTSILDVTQGIWIAKVDQNAVDFAMAGERKVASTNAVTTVNTIPGVVLMSGGPLYRHVVMLPGK